MNKKWPELRVSAFEKPHA